MSEFNHGFGFIPGESDPRDYVFGVSGAAIPDEYLPEVKAAVHDQGQINNCATHALSASLENSLGGKIGFGWYYGNRRYSDHKGQGTIERDLLKAAQKDGGLSWKKYPHEEEMPAAMERFEKVADGMLAAALKLSIGNYWALRSFDEVRRALYEGKFVQLGLQLFAGIKKVTAESPVLAEPSISGTQVEEWLGGHMVWATGYCVKNGVRCIRCRNSWGPGWGENGDFYVPEGYFTWAERMGFPLPLAEPWAFELGAHEEQPSGWYKQDGKWRYSKDGADAVGWLKDKGVWYYLDPDGYMAANVWRKVNGWWYYLTGSGAMAAGWRKVGKYWYYLNPQSGREPKGGMLTGLREIGGKKYFLNPVGAHGVPEGALIVTDESGVVTV